jgi:dephospho-CoA kinase
MGKSTAAKLLLSLGVPVFDADAVVHKLMKPGTTAAAEIEARFPGITNSRGVDRQKLGSIVFSDPKALTDLEGIIHPRTRLARKHFLRQAALQRRSIVALDIPLLFESNSDTLCDAAIVVSAPAFLQKQRALARPAMSEAKLKGILAHQMPDAKKRLRADIVVPSGLGKRETLRGLLKFLNVLRQRHKRAAQT